MELVEIRDNHVFTDSLGIAEHFDKRHSDVIRSVEKLPKDEFNQRNFALVKYVDAKGESRPMYRMTRDGFSLIAMGFTGKKAYQWKLNYLKAFNRMETIIIERQSSEWMLTRSHGKMVRRKETDSIQLFIQLAISQGSSNFKMYYKHFTGLVHSTVGIKDGERDLITPQTLMLIGTIEAKISELIHNLVRQELYYKDIYKEVKKQVELLANFLPLESNVYLPTPQVKPQLEASA